MSPKKKASKKAKTTAARATKKPAKKPAKKATARRKGTAARKATVKPQKKATAKRTRARGPAEKATKVKPTARKTGRSIRKKAPPGAPAASRPTERQQPERVKVGGLRTLGDVEPDARGAGSSTKQTPTTRKARAVLEQEFERALALKEKLAAESAIGGREKGREATRQQEKLRALVNSLEGMNRFAMQMGLITPGESRELYAEAMQKGLYEGWVR